jgi:hypothetical protein
MSTAIVTMSMSLDGCVADRRGRGQGDATCFVARMVVLENLVITEGDGVTPLHYRVKR